jgi:hypothetical protein
MSRKVAVLVIHGMGSQGKDFADDSIEEITRRVADKGKNPDDIAWKSVYWADVIEPRQKKFMQDIISHKDNDIDFVKLRKFVVSAIGDAAAYQSVRGSKTSTYTKVHERIKSCIKELYDNQLEKEPCPLIVMAHSMGGHIMSNYIWDMQHKKNKRLNDFESMKYLAGMLTFGCNIPLFAFAHTELEPFSFPGDMLTDAQKAKAKWLNFYDSDDVFGYPLRQIGPKFKFVKDKHINAGGLLTSWNPLSHSAYWTDNDMTKPAAGMIAGFM